MSEYMNVCTYTRIYMCKYVCYAHMYDVRMYVHMYGVVVCRYICIYVYMCMLLQYCQFVQKMFSCPNKECT